MSLYFPEPYEGTGGNVKVKLDLSNHARKVDLKWLNQIYNLSKLTNGVDSNVIKKAMYDKLTAKVNTITTKISSTSRLVTKTLYDLD